MPKLNFQVFLNGYNDSSQTSTPMLSNFKWNREINGIPYTTENSQMVHLAPGATANIIVSDTKSFLYLDSDQQITVIYNGGSAITLSPFQISGKLQPGCFLISGPVTSVTITNPGSVAASVFFATMG